MDFRNEINKEQNATRTPNSSKDRHRKVGGRHCRIRLPPSCASQLFELTQKLGFKTEGETVGWLLRNVEPAIFVATGHGLKTTPNDVVHPITNFPSYTISGNTNGANSINNSFPYMGVNTDQHEMVVPEAEIADYAPSSSTFPENDMRGMPADVSTQNQFELGETETAATETTYVWRE